MSHARRKSGERQNAVIIHAETTRRTTRIILLAIELNTTKISRLPRASRLRLKFLYNCASQRHLSTEALLGSVLKGYTSNLVRESSSR